MKHQRTIIALGCAWYILAFFIMNTYIVITLADLQHPRNDVFDAYSEGWLAGYEQLDQTLYVGPTWFSPDAKIKGCMLLSRHGIDLKNKKGERNILSYFDKQNKVWRITLSWRTETDFTTAQVVVRALDGKVLLVDSGELYEASFHAME